MGEVDKLLINEHASDAAGVLSVFREDDLVNGITNEVLSANSVLNGDSIEFSHGDAGKGKNGDLLGRILAAGSLRVGSVAIATSATSAAVVSASVVLVVGVALLVATLVSTIVISLVAVAALVLIGEAHQCLNDLPGGSVLFALSLLILFVFGDPHLNLNGLGGSEDVLAVESLDCLLSVGNGVVQNVGILGLDFHFSTKISNCGAQLKRNYTLVITE